MVRSARARPKGRRSHSAPQDLDATALRLDSTASRYRSPHVDHANHSERSTAEGWTLKARRNGASIATTDSTVMAIAPATSGTIEVLFVP